MNNLIIQRKTLLLRVTMLFIIAESILLKVIDRRL